MNRRAYGTDLSDAQWKLIEPELPPRKKEGLPRRVDLREVVNAILYVLSNGVKWREIPHDFPNWNTVFKYYRRWIIDGVWERLHTKLREELRRKSGKEPTPSLAIVDSQTTRTSELADSAGYDAGKKTD